MTDAKPDDAVSMAEAAQILGISASTLQARKALGRYRGLTRYRTVEQGRERVWFSRREVEAYTPDPDRRGRPKGRKYKETTLRLTPDLYAKVRKTQRPNESLAEALRRLLDYGLMMDKARRTARN